MTLVSSSLLYDNKKVLVRFHMYKKLL